MYKLRILTMALCATTLVACTTGNTSMPTTTNQQIGTMAGATPTYGEVNGLVLDRTISKSMDQQDKINTQQALVATPMGQQAVWTNTTTKTSYTVKPVNEYQSGSAKCRQSQIIINTGKRTTYTTVCQGPDGQWYAKQ